MRIAVTGAAGQLGRAVVRECQALHDVVALDHHALDIEDDGAVARRMAEIHPNAIVNCAAYNNVDGAEDELLRALALNAFAVRRLARAAEACGASFVHYGSDFVFDGTATVPYLEDARPNPLSAYGASKLLGEYFAETKGVWFVLRVESLFGQVPGAAAKGTIASIRSRLTSGEVVRVFQDRVVTPSYVFDVASATRFVVEHHVRSGFYHCVNSGVCTWPELVRHLATELCVEPRLDLVKSSDVRLRAARPLYCALSNRKL